MLLWQQRLGGVNDVSGRREQQMETKQRVRLSNEVKIELQHHHKGNHVWKWQNTREGGSEQVSGLVTSLPVDSVPVDGIEDFYDN